MDDTISRQAVIDELNAEAELLRRALDNTNLVGAERKKYEWGLSLIESCISDMKDLPPSASTPTIFMQPIVVDFKSIGEKIGEALANNDIVEVVRCKECKYWHREIHNGTEYFNYSSCDLNHCGDGNNFYCGDGKRRDDD